MCGSWGSEGCGGCGGCGGFIWGFGRALREWSGLRILGHFHFWSCSFNYANFSTVVC